MDYDFSFFLCNKYPVKYKQILKMAFFFFP